MTELTQQTQLSGQHQLRFSSEKLVLTSLRGHEGISEVSRFQLQLLSEDVRLPPNALAGWQTAEIRQSDDSFRKFHGICISLERGDVSKHGDNKRRRSYFAELVAWPWMLTRRSNCRVFQDMTVTEILAAVFKSAGFDTGFWDMSGIRGEHRTREYCVQYRETDFNFVSRLMEEEGIFYFFKPNQMEMMVLSDQAVYQECVTKPVALPETISSSAPSEHLTSWKRRHQQITSSWAQDDYNFESPETNLETGTSTIVKNMGDSEFFDYPGLYKTTSDGKPLTQVRMEEEEATHETVEASSVCTEFAAGHTFQVGYHRASEEKDKSYVITSIDHLVGETRPFETGVAGTHGYTNRITCIPDSVVFRPGRRTLKPSIQGMQSAKVVGPEGDEIYTDKYGRIKVHFHWDRLMREWTETKPEEASCWIRVAQMSAGEQWGMHFWPRVGHEVVVAFLEGDPDQPLVIGSVYNGKNMPPYALPENQTRSGVKTRSTPDGGPDNFNEIRFEDRKGEEELYIHAEKDLNTVVEKEETRTVGGSRVTNVHNHNKTTIEKGDREATIKEGNDNLSVEQGDINQSCPNGSFNIMGKDVTIHGTDFIRLVCGGSMIQLTPGQIEIYSGTIQTIGTDIRDIASAEHSIVGGVVLSTASGPNTVQGAVVKLNC